MAIIGPSTRTVPAPGLDALAEGHFEPPSERLIGLMQALRSLVRSHGQFGRYSISTRQKMSAYPPFSLRMSPCTHSYGPASSSGQRHISRHLGRLPLGHPPLNATTTVVRLRIPEQSKEPCDGAFARLARFRSLLLVGIH